MNEIQARYAEYLKSLPKGVDLLQQWWSETYPNAGVENVYQVSDDIIELKDLISFQEWVIAKLTTHE